MGETNTEWAYPELLAPDSVFANRYRVEKRIAQGGFGEVYAVEDTVTESRRALKVLAVRWHLTQEVIRKFELEARVPGRVGSEFIVAVMDTGFDPETRLPFLVMELLSGEDLQRCVERRGPLTPLEVITYLRHVSLGLDKAHRYVDRSGQPAPIVHRDLKPENLFLTHREDGTPLVKILDFGIAKVLNQPAAQSVMALQGTPLYMAYEQAAGHPVTAAADLWALGLIAFFLLTGRSYWLSPRAPDAGVEALIAEILNRPLVPASERAQALGSSVEFSSDFDAWFARCVNRAPDARFGGALEAIEALAQAFKLSLPSAPAVSIPRLEHGTPSGAQGLEKTVILEESSPVLDVRQRTTGPVTTERRSYGGLRPRGSWLALAAVGLGVAVVGAWWWRPASPPPAGVMSDSVGPGAAQSTPAPPPEQAPALPSPSPADPLESESETTPPVSDAGPDIGASEAGARPQAPVIAPVLDAAPKGQRTAAPGSGILPPKPKTERVDSQPSAGGSDAGLKRAPRSSAAKQEPLMDIR